MKRVSDSFHSSTGHVPTAKARTPKANSPSTCATVADLRNLSMTRWFFLTLVVSIATSLRIKTVNTPNVKFYAILAPVRHVTSVFQFDAIVKKSQSMCLVR